MFQEQMARFSSSCKVATIFWPPGHCLIVFVRAPAIHDQFSRGESASDPLAPGRKFFLFGVTLQAPLNNDAAGPR